MLDKPTPRQPQPSPEEVLDNKRERVWKDLVRHEGWKLYTELLENYMKQQGVKILKPLNNLFEAPASEYEKGTLNGLQLAFDAVPVFLHQRQELRNLSTDADEDQPPEE